MTPSEPYTIPDGADIGHVHLKVSDLARALTFYEGVLGLQVMHRMGDHAAFLSAGGYHHHLGLNTWESRGGSPPPRGSTGLFHVAFRYPDRGALARAVRQVLAAGVAIEGAADHAVSHSVYLRDPDGNGVELTTDTPRESWRTRPDGSLELVTEPLDLAALLAEAKD